jgi:NADH-quinone oxidoreductase subunit J
MEIFLFLLLGAICVLSAVNILIQRKPIYSALSLIVTFLALAGIYIQMHAEFIAVMQVVIYTGAIMVLFVFVIMLLNAKDEERVPGKGLVIKYLAVPLVLLLLMEGALVMFSSFSNLEVEVGGSSAQLAGNVQAIGRLLYTRYALPVELTSVLLLVAIVGAILLGKKEL